MPKVTTTFAMALRQGLSTFLHQRTVKKRKKITDQQHTIAVNGPDCHNHFVNQSYRFISRILMFRK